MTGRRPSGHHTRSSCACFFACHSAASAVLLWCSCCVFVVSWQACLVLSRPVLVSVKEADQGGEVLQTRAISRRDLYDSSYSDYELSPGGLAEQTLADCKVEEDGAVSINGTVACTLMIEGADEILSRKEDSVDGMYILAGCYNGRPKYERNDDAEGARVIWFSDYYGDWSLSEGLETPPYDGQRMWPVLAWGGEGNFNLRPQLVAPMTWYVNASLSNLPNTDNDIWLLATSLNVECDDEDLQDESQLAADVRGDANTAGSLQLALPPPAPGHRGKVLAPADAKWSGKYSGSGAGQWRGPILGLVLVFGTMMVVIIPLRTYLRDSQRRQERGESREDHNVREAEMTRLVKGDDAR